MPLAGATSNAVACDMTWEPIPEFPDVLRIQLHAHRDERGFFVERWRAEREQDLGIGPLSQLNHSRSTRDTLRGLHFQAPPHAQGKLVGVVRGAIYDAFVDLRRGSPSYGRATGVLLDDRAQQLLWIPRGFAHGFLVLSEVADVLYQVDAGYAPTAEGGLRWDDPQLAIAWPLPRGSAPRLSAKDATWPRWRDFASPFA
jgi:dTDP-4-dehydrorhamnose 3,5-epimerase